MPNKKQPRSLKATLLVVIGGCLFIFALLIFYLFFSTMPGMLLQSETKYLSEQLRATEGHFEWARQNTYIMAEDIAVWESTVEYVHGDYPNYIQENWPEATPLEAYQFNLLLIKDVEGNNRYSEFYNFIDETHAVTPRGLSEHLKTISQYVMDKYETDPPSSAAAIEDYGVGGIFFHNGQPYFISCMPIMASREAGVPHGTVTLGLLIDDEYMRWLTSFDTIHFIWNEDPTPEELVQTTTYNGNDTVTTVIPMKDIEGNDITLSLTDTRPIYTEGQRTIYVALAITVLLLAALALILYAAVNRLFLRPVRKLNDELSNIAVTGSINADKYSGSREFASLASAVNSMLHRLNQSNVSIFTMQSILDGIDLNILVTELDTDKILFVNDTMRRHFGVTGDITGQVCWKVFNGRSERCPGCPADQLQANPDAHIVWEQQNPKTGRSFRNTDAMIDWVDGHKAHIQMTVDITADKEAAAALSRRLAQQELMTAISQSFISTEDENTLISRALDMAGTFIGSSKILLARADAENLMMHIENAWYNPQQDVKRLAFDSYPYQPGEGMYEAFEAGREAYIAIDDISTHPEHSDMLPSGVKGFIAAPVFAKDGRLWGVISFDECRYVYHWTDSDIHLILLITSLVSGLITRGEMEKDLLRMSSIVQNSPQYITYVNSENQFEYMNPAVPQLTGYTRDELMAGGLELLFSPEVYKTVRDEYIPEAVNKRHLQFEQPIRLKNGSTRLMLFSAFTTGSGTVGCIATDVTEQRRLEKDLVAAKEQAEQSSLAKSNFLSRMSHEMRTPMNAIIGMTGIARASNDAARKDYCLDKIDEASTHLLGVINDILDVSKIEAGKFDLHTAEFDFEKMLQRVTGVVNFRIDEKKQNLIIKADTAVPGSLIGDEQRLAQVLTNLLGNAVKFTPEGGTITLGVRHLGEENGLHSLQFEVRDTGIGISAEQQTRLFQSFEQADGGIARKFGGTGLGLSISRSIVEMMGGTIWVESELDKGALFAFKVAMPAGSAPRQLPAATAADWKKLHVLVVDDAPEVLDYFGELAAQMGFTCDTALSGEEAIRLLDAAGDVPPYQVIFVDWHMPGMNGLELARHIKQHYGSHTIVVMISAAQWDEVEAEAKAAGVDRFLPKPLFASLVADCLNTLLGGGEGPSAQQEDSTRDAGCLEGYTALLAEDIEINREIVYAMLEHTGLAIKSAENGAEAVRMVKENPGAFDIVLMDIHMPEMDGFEATRRIRALKAPEVKHLPIVAMTANVFREDVEKCLAAGMNDHIGKPINAEELLEKLKKYLLAGA